MKSNTGTFTDNLDRSEWNASRSFKQMMSNLEEAFNQDNNEHEEDMNVQSSSQEFFEQPHGS